MSADVRVYAMVGNRKFTDRSWNGIVSRVVSAYQLTTTSKERVTAARYLDEGNTARLRHVTIRPVAS